jgi:hypothetical protein
MYHYTHVSPAHDFTIKDRRGNPHTHHAEEEIYEVYPILSDVHSWLFGDFGPMYANWFDGALCPFASGVRNRNIHCTAGLRKHCSGLGLDYRNFTGHLDEDLRNRLIGKVTCGEWFHRLADAYWNVDLSQYHDWPDDPTPVAVDILRKIYRESGWFTWRREEKKRETVSWSSWQSPLEKWKTKMRQ